MKKLLSLFFLLIFFYNYGQIIQGRVLDIDPLNLDKMKSAVAEKTKMFNSKEGSSRFSTFEIISGPQANNFIEFKSLITSVNLISQLVKRNLIFGRKILVNFTLLWLIGFGR